MEKLMPLGSVLKLKNSPSLIMVAGYYVVDETENELKQYIGIHYPLGLSKSIKFIMFDEKSIEKILYRGYEDEKVIEYNKKLVQMVNEKEMVKKLLK